MNKKLSSPELNSAFNKIRKKQISIFKKMNGLNY